MTSDIPGTPAPADDRPVPSPFGDSGTPTTRKFPGFGGAGGSGLPKWAWPVGIVVLVLLLVVLPLVKGYNDMVNKDESVKTAFSNVDVAMQRRLDLIPNLAASAKAILKQEQEVFGTIAEARARYGGTTDPNAKIEASNQMESAFSRLLVIIEQYPQLRSSETIRDLMTELSGSENRISQARRDFNDVAQDYNKTIRRFPRSMMAGMFGFERAELFVARPGADQPPPVDLSTS